MEIQEQTIKQNIQILPAWGRGNNFNFPYEDPDKVREVFEAVGVENISKNKAKSAVLAYLYPDIFPEGFFSKEGVEMGQFRDVKDKTRKGIVVRYENSFGWGDGDIKFSYRKSTEPPEFSDHDLWVLLETIDGWKFRVPETNDFSNGTLTSIILGERAGEVVKVNPDATFFSCHSPIEKFTSSKVESSKYGTLFMSPRDPTYENVSAAAGLLKEVLAVLQGEEAESGLERYQGIAAKGPAMDKVDKALDEAHEKYDSACKLHDFVLNMKTKRCETFTRYVSNKKKELKSHAQDLEMQKAEILGSLGAIVRKRRAQGQDSRALPAEIQVHHCPKTGKMQVD